MRKIFSLFLLAAYTSSAFFSLEARNLTQDIPVIDQNVNSNFNKVPDVAQYGNGDWSGVVGIAHKVSLERAYKIAEANPEITFFFYMKGYQMVLGDPQGDYRVFRKGDAVFFTGEPHWGEARGFADGYIKK